MEGQPASAGCTFGQLKVMVQEGFANVESYDIESIELNDSKHGFGPRTLSRRGDPLQLLSERHAMFIVQMESSNKSRHVKPAVLIQYNVFMIVSAQSPP